ncbi:hypothetical protein GCM10010178_39610 [Lentzea flava]|uniref:Core domain-containing protein n=1 Tax=Lentzea flava TaxID=103732 RepID=A0ABQ2UL57_9PSEU|nr:Iron-sulfur cluster assembly accessory protein [Lentzea flava]GGU43019.1 hypothetical protein GCM10010178_39610 [Lentzea flava]
MLRSVAVSSLQENFAVNATGVTLTPAAVEKVKALLSQEGRSDMRLRIAVQPGGCAGLRYQLFFDDRLFDSDLVTKYGPPDDADYDSGHESGADN